MKNFIFSQELFFYFSRSKQYRCSSVELQRGGLNLIIFNNVFHYEQKEKQITKYIKYFANTKPRADVSQQL